MPILDLSSCKSGDSFSGIGCIKSMTIAKTKAGKDYIYGTLINQRNRWDFKVWSGTVVSEMRNYLNAEGGFKPLVANIVGTAGTYNGAIDFTVESITPDTSTPYSDFLPTLDTEDLFNKLSTFINGNLSGNWIQALMSILTLGSEYFYKANPKEGEPLIALMKKTWAASSNHDAIQGGLVNHTVKMLNIAKTVFDDHPNLMNYKDLVYAGIILHDIGKTQEIVDGNYTKNSFVSHRVMGIEYMAMAKSQLLNYISIDDYYRLLDIIIGHHDQYGTPADTTWTYLVHLIDMLDTYATMFDEMLTNDTAGTNKSGERTFRMSDKTLVF